MVEAREVVCRVSRRAVSGEAVSKGVQILHVRTYARVLVQFIFYKFLVVRRTPT